MSSLSIIGFLFRYKQCGCVSPGIWAARYVTLPGQKDVIKAPLCIPSSSCYSNASSVLATSETLWNEFCSHCKPACSYVDYTITTSGANTIADSYVPTIKAFVENTRVPLPPNWNTSWLDAIRKSYFSFEVVCETTMIENYEQLATVTATDVLSSVGGQSGLWIGISFLSIMEVVEMVYHLIRFQCRRHYTSSNRSHGF